MLEKRGDTLRRRCCSVPTRRWARADVQLVPIATGSPLSPGAVSPDGRIAAFPQPGELVTVDATTAEVIRFALPSRGPPQRVLAGDSRARAGQRTWCGLSRAGGRGRVGEGPLVQVTGGQRPAMRSQRRTGWTAGPWCGTWSAASGSSDSDLQLPVRSWVGQTFSTSSDRRPAVHRERPAAGADEGLSTPGRGGDLHPARAAQPPAGAGRDRPAAPPRTPAGPTAPTSASPAVAPYSAGTTTARRCCRSEAGCLAWDLSVQAECGESPNSTWTVWLSARASGPEPSSMMHRRVIVDQAVGVLGRRHRLARSARG